MLGQDPETVAKLKAELSKDIAKHFESITNKPVLIWTPTSDIDTILEGLRLEGLRLEGSSNDEFFW
jgi:hypothetical protein